VATSSGKVIGGTSAPPAARVLAAGPGTGQGRTAERILTGADPGLHALANLTPLVGPITRRGH
jgi:hypothetical protein